MTDFSLLFETYIYNSKFCEIFYKHIYPFICTDSIEKPFRLPNVRLLGKCLYVSKVSSRLLYESTFQTEANKKKQTKLTAHFP